MTDPGISSDTVAFGVGGGAPFSFCGVDYDEIWLTDDGFVVFDAVTNYDGEPWVPQALPDPQAPNNLLAMLWQDMAIVYDEATNRCVTVVEVDGTGPGSALVIEYDDVQLVEDPQSTYDVQLVAFRGQDDTPGNYEFYVAYGDVTGPVGGPLTVGTENADGTSGQALVNSDSGEGIVAEDSVVCFEYTGASLAPVTISYEVTVDEEGLSNGDVLTNEATHITDNPGAQPVTVGVGVTIEGVVEQPTEESTVTPTEEPTDGAGPPADGAGPAGPAGPAGRGPSPHRCGDRTPRRRRVGPGRSRRGSDADAKADRVAGLHHDRRRPACGGGRRGLLVTPR